MWTCCLWDKNSRKLNQNFPSLVFVLDFLLSPNYSNTLIFCALPTAAPWLHLICKALSTSYFYLSHARTPDRRMKKSIFWHALVFFSCHAANLSVSSFNNSVFFLFLFSFTKLQGEIFSFYIQQSIEKEKFANTVRQPPATIQ